MLPSFNFLNLEELPAFEDALVARVPPRIADSRVLLRSVADALGFPAYFGENWNALFDCLRDFHWIGERRIVLLHADVPRIPKDELKIYLEVLRDAAADWKAGEPHEFLVVFDEKDKGAVTSELME